MTAESPHLDLNNVDFEGRPNYLRGVSAKLMKREPDKRYKF